MGRRSKNKQAPPQPYREEKANVTQANTKGKRKADDQSFVAKKAKTAAPGRAPTDSKAAATRSNGVKSAKPSSLKASKKSAIVSPPTVEDDEDDDEHDSGMEYEDLDEDDIVQGEAEEDGLDQDDDVDEDSDEGKLDPEEEESDEEDEEEEDPIAALGLPKNGKLSERQRKKALAEAERLEELLKSQGLSLESDEEEGEGESYDEEEDDGIDLEAGTDEEVLEDDFDDDIGERDIADELEVDDGLNEDEDDDDVAEGGEESEFMLPTMEERESEKVRGADLQLVHMRIQEIVTVLSSFKKLAIDGRSRSEYIEQLLGDICTYYGYNTFLAEKLFNLFTPAEAIEFFEANETPRPVTIRANTLRTRRRDLAQALINRGVNLEPIGGWTKVGLQVFESSVPIGATPEYLAGHYMLQAASSFLPCIALAPQPNERVLDMASAPGGKSTYLSALMQNTGTVFANDSNKNRIKSLTANIHRLGCKNVVVCNYDGRQFPKVIGGFDRVLLDSPCSGTGVIHKDQSVKTNKSDRDFTLLTHLQKQLLLCAIDSVNPRSKTGGYVVYSTCSVMTEENEEVVQYALRKRSNVKIVSTGIEFGRDGFKSFGNKHFDDKMVLARRIFPHVHNLDGFFVCKLKVDNPTAKTAPGTVQTRQSVTQDMTPDDAEVGSNPSAFTLLDNPEDRKLIEKSLKKAAGKSRRSSKPK